MSYEDKLQELFIELPEPPAESGNAVGAVFAGKLLYTGGVFPFSEGRMQHQGRVGIEVRADSARMAARIAAINAVALAKRELGTLDRIKRIVRIDGFVACGADFRDHFKIMDGAGELFAQILGANGKCARTAAGVLCLPHNACIEIAVVFETTNSSRS